MQFASSATLQANGVVTRLGVVSISATAGATIAGLIADVGVVTFGATAGLTSVAGIMYPSGQVTYAGTTGLAVTPVLTVQAQQLAFFATSGVVVAASPISMQSQVTFGATTAMAIGAVNLGGTCISFVSTVSLAVHGDVPDTPPSSNLYRLQPRLAVMAAGSSAGRYLTSAANVSSAVATRNRLPLTQVQFYAQRLSQRR
jgi:hypothetical protein